MVTILDFKQPDGKYDYDNYNKARQAERQKDIANGKYCRRCGAYQVWAKGAPTLCFDCKSMDEDSGEVSSDNYIRCPKCRDQFNLHDGDSYDLFEDGDHDVTCWSCDHEFTITTHVSYSFQSPELLMADSEEEEPTNA